MVRFTFLITAWKKGTNANWVRIKLECFLKRLEIQNGKEDSPNESWDTEWWNLGAARSSLSLRQRPNLMK